MATKGFSTRIEPLRLEVKLPDGRWFSNGERGMTDAMREETLTFLAENPDRYYYPPYLNGRCRVSYEEPSG